MELKEFIEETLVQITEGIKSAQEKCFESNGLINPLLEVPHVMGKTFEFKDKHYPKTEIKFKIGLTQTDINGNKKGIGVSFGNFNIGGQNKEEVNTQSVTNIEFSINTVQPFLNRKGKATDLSGVFY